MVWHAFDACLSCFYGVLFGCFGLSMYLFGVFLFIPRYFLGLDLVFRPISEWIVWYSGIPIVLGFALSLVDLFTLLPNKRLDCTNVRTDTIDNHDVTVALTAYNDEQSIGAAVRDFKNHPLVKRVIVISNNSIDGTIPVAQAAGAITYNETAQGYGHCVYRCLTEASKFVDTDFVVLSEGDRTFRGQDIDKLIAYAPHADIVNGTRTVERLREYSTQLSTFMYYGNIFVAKLLEAKHLGRGTMTDVGTTYKLCRRTALAGMLPMLDPRVNLEFNPHFLDVALREGYSVVECPVTFHSRVGVSKGGNTDNIRALKVGCRMMIGIIAGWRWVA